MQTLHIVDDDEALRDSLETLLKSHSIEAIPYESGAPFLNLDLTKIQAPILLDIRMPGKSGIEVLAEALQRNGKLKIIMMSAHADIAIAVQAVKIGAMDFLEKPFRHEKLLPMIEKAQLEIDAEAQEERLINKLTPRERQVMAMLADGNPNKIIAADLGISIRTVETHRAHLMAKLDVTSLSDLIKLHLSMG